MLVFLLFSFFLVNSFKHYFEDHVICLTNKTIAAILMAHTLFWYSYKLMNLININIYINYFYNHMFLHILWEFEWTVTRIFILYQS